jgi:hypothetical protein
MSVSPESIFLKKLERSGRGFSPPLCAPPHAIFLPVKVKLNNNTAQGHEVEKVMPPSFVSPVLCLLFPEKRILPSPFTVH